MMYMGILNQKEIEEAYIKTQWSKRYSTQIVLVLYHRLDSSVEGLVEA